MTPLGPQRGRRNWWQRLLALPGRGLRRWRASLRGRVLTTTLVVGLVALAVLGSYLSNRISQDLFDARVSEILAESARSTDQTQLSLKSSTATTGLEIQQLFKDLVPSLQRASGDNRAVFLIATDRFGSMFQVNDMVTHPALRELIGDELRDAVGQGEGQYWQSVEIPEGDFTAAQGPGVLVGSAVQVPVVGQYELYFLYSLNSEQQTLNMLSRSLIIGAVVLVLLLVTMTFAVTRQVVRPVRAAARVAERLADGQLTQRMQVRGHDEIASLAVSFNEMADSLQVQIHRLERLSAVQRRFVSDVSHELRTPLTTIRMAGEIIHLYREDFPAEVRRSAELLYNQLDRFEDLLADLLEISRFDAGAAELDAHKQDLNELVLNAVDLTLPLAVNRNTWISVKLPDTPSHADVDPRRVSRILRNLLGNAIEHADGTEVEIQVAADSLAVAVTVRDRGVGMTSQEAERVFDRFWRADPARARTTGGTGLGLSIALEDAHLHEGWLHVWARPRQGASFRLTLPKRAGIKLESSPLPLQPEQEPDHADQPAAVSDPSKLPDFDQLGGDDA